MESNPYQDLLFLPLLLLLVREAQEPDDEPGQGEAAGEDKTVSETDAKTERETPRVVRKRSSSR